MCGILRSRCCQRCQAVTVQLSSQIGSAPAPRHSVWTPIHFWAPVETGDDGRGRGPRSLPCQHLPLGEQAAVGPSVQASWLGSLESRAWRGRWRRTGGGGVERGHVEGKGGARGWVTKRCLLSFKPPPSWEYSHYFSSRIISAFKEHCGKFRPELQYSEARKTVSGPKIREDLLF